MDGHDSPPRSPRGTGPGQPGGCPHWISSRAAHNSTGECPRRLWDLADNIRDAWLRDGKLPAYGATVTITPDGGVQLTRGHWQATIPAG
jgi:hypothetical protein